MVAIALDAAELEGLVASDAAHVLSRRVVGWQKAQIHPLVTGDLRR